MSINDVAIMSDLEKVSNEIDNRANMALVYEKHNEVKQGVEELKEQYQDVYTSQALNDVIEEYKANKYNEHVEALESYDNYSKSLVSKANMLADKLESNLQSATDPTTQYELDQHNYLVDKLKNSLVTAFTGSNPDLNELNSVLKQAESNKDYARALTHLHAMLINNIEGNNKIEDTKKHQLRSSINTKMDELQQSLLPYEYKQLQNIKAKLERNELAVIGQKHRYEMLKHMYEGGNMDKYKLPKGSLQ
ncbi:hypothetical protein SEQMU2_14925 [Staphylococcus equorum subsp. equorum Mu2]|uniref:hypothetical protein n=1 Tax=Staphylococcus equorum TaxID=246432 RepID=UPI000267DD5D|nr:hypothetical protein [Staphylococcus equorum]CCI61338.1 hypothetical protein SEQMU2_14925 [Staphylococcus equorum subsp. equorum Mu2]